MKTVVAVIAYNEEQNIRKALDDLIDHNTGFDVVVIDNASSDHTADICREMNVDVISHCANTGGSYGTLMTYFMYAYKYGYDILCQFDGDGQHVAAELPKIIDPIKNDEADYVVGSRFLKKQQFQSFFFRRIGINVFSFLCSKVTGQKITDVTSGFRAYSRKTVEYFVRHYKHEIYDTSQLLLLGYFGGARIKEVPVVMRKREYGKSEYNSINALWFPVKGLINITGCLLQRNQIKKNL
jgi:glycosyltransferase involved in cell wall biosynthesis